VKGDKKKEGEGVGEEKEGKIKRGEGREKKREEKGRQCHLISALFPTTTVLLFRSQSHIHH
jgi:hypothetical protein